MELDGRVALVTGASRGLGVRIAEALAAQGCSLALAARSTDALEAAAGRIGRRGVRTIAVPTDVTRRADLENLVKTTESELGPIDVLVNNAGVECVGYFERIEPEEITATIATNLESVIELTRLVVPGMLERGRGHIANISSAAGKSSRPFGVVYSATKHGIVGFSWGLRAELGPRGVGVSVVCPAYVTGEGMFAAREHRAGRVPPALKTVSAADVAAKTVDAIRKDRAEVVVGPPLVRIADIGHAISPHMAMWVGRRSGLFSFLRREATGE